MTFKKTLFFVVTLSLMAFYSCNETAGEKLEEDIENKSDRLDDRADNLEDAADYVEDGFDDIEDAIENFREALENVDNPEDRKAIRERINKIMDDLEFKKEGDF
ncbi:hypothetical protein Q2T40_12830 [Winogradskyella maritima]|uniref:Uncharacterized protein n=1 Tax=Winogradskyella maritima TaxID=1517766 RepID=A0ABV8AIX8_9FLAO|nr:hypothetical protein [Winogradskyella maritima]